MSKHALPCVCLHPGLALLPVCHSGSSPAASPGRAIQGGGTGPSTEPFPLAPSPDMFSWRFVHWDAAGRSARDSPHRDPAPQPRAGLRAPEHHLTALATTGSSTGHSFQNANFSFWKRVWQTPLNELKNNTPPWSQAFPRMMKGWRLRWRRLLSTLLVNDVRNIAHLCWRCSVL